MDVLFVDEYRKGWTFRYLREARADLSTAEKSPPLMAISEAVLAMKKAQAAVYYSLGDPVYLEPMIYQIAERKIRISDPLLSCLVKIEQKIRALSEMTESIIKVALREAHFIIEITTDIVEAVTGEKVEDHA